MKWGWSRGDGPGRDAAAAKLLKWAITVFFLVLGFATLAAYIKIGIEHQDRYGERYVPARLQAPLPGGNPAKASSERSSIPMSGDRRRPRRAAHGIGAKRRGHDVVILSLVPPKRSHSAAAQGGMQASLGNVIKGQGDNEDVHFEDTVRGSDWGADQRVVRMFVNTAPKAVRELAAWGVPWSRVKRATATSSSMPRR